jgi:prepilin-type N-terminal cleavage/methylation domain-containing protein
MFRHTHRNSQEKGFTLIELIISIAIFALMTVLLIVKYGTFNDSVLLTNLAYDVAATIRTAQTYGLSVRSGEDSCDNTDDRFKCAYGVRFDTANPKVFSIFSIFPVESTDPDEYIDSFSPSNNAVNFQDVDPTYTLKRGAKFSSVCYGVNSCDVYDGELEIVFLRPNPNAILCYQGVCHTGGYAEVFIEGTDGSVRSVVVLSNGQISVKE